MEYSTIIPDKTVQTVVECYWVVRGDDTKEQKIIPDGFPEMIFHFGEPYLLIDATGRSTIQQNVLLSGQLLQPILLKPSGVSDVFGIKFKPSGVWRLLHLDMSTVKNAVIPFTAQSEIVSLYNKLRTIQFQERADEVDRFISERLNLINDNLDAIVHTIESKNGDISLSEISEAHNISVRTLQRMFNERIGLTVKQYSRLTRFRTVYALLQKPSLTKTDAVFLTGYFDQPHFNREFRTFTQENPESWFRDTHTFANFFMNR